MRRLPKSCTVKYTITILLVSCRRSGDFLFTATYEMLIKSLLRYWTASLSVVEKTSLSKIRVWCVCVCVWQRSNHFRRYLSREYIGPSLVLRWLYAVALLAATPKQRYSGASRTTSVFNRSRQTTASRSTITVITDESHHDVNLFQFMRHAFLVLTRTRLHYVRIYAVANSSVCRLYRSCALLSRLKFSAMFLAFLYLSHPLTFMQNFAEIVPGEPLRWGPKTQEG